MSIKVERIVRKSRDRAMEDAGITIALDKSPKMARIYPQTVSRRDPVTKWRALVSSCTKGHESLPALFDVAFVNRKSETPKEQVQSISSIDASRGTTF